LQDSEPDVIDGVGAETGHVIRTSIGGRNGQSKQVKRITFWSFGVWQFSNSRGSGIIVELLTTGKFCLTPVFLFELTECQLYCRTRGRNRLFWCCFPGETYLLGLILISFVNPVLSTY